MGQQHSAEERHVLVMANATPNSSHDLLLRLSEYSSGLSNVIVYSFKEYKEGRTKIIDQKDEVTLKNLNLVLVIGENRDLMLAFSIFKGIDSPLIFGIGHTEDYSMPLIYNFSRYQLDDVVELILQEPNWDHLPRDNLMKLSVSINSQKMAEATCQLEIHRGMQQSILILNIYI
jgi:hypothetical protein